MLSCLHWFIQNADGEIFVIVLLMSSSMPTIHIVRNDEKQKIHLIGWARTSLFVLVSFISALALVWIHCIQSVAWCSVYSRKCRIYRKHIQHTNSWSLSSALSSVEKKDEQRTEQQKSHLIFSYLFGYFLHGVVRFIIQFHWNSCTKRIVPGENWI